MSDLSIMIGNIPLRVVDNGNGTFSIASVINAAIPSGANLIGKAGIDQTTDGTTNRVVAKISQNANENVVAITNLDIALSALRDAIVKTGETSKTLADLAALIGALADSAVVDPTASGSEIALLKGIIKQLQGDGTEGKAAPVSVVGDTLVETKNQADAVAGVVTFSENIKAIGILNTDLANDGVFTVNGIAIPVPKGTPFKDIIGGIPAASVAISGATTYNLLRYE
jgi:hypothetical protein